ncbi:GOLPH3/VPS74 family protein [Saccharothrix obliqua]|uniref:GOLPH3/VPS74 family protein n=1 Tax=Saccharothrix obliqua TaxID=2861747 RepID=UPI001C5DD2BD|nr:GPP34 family phosphoprotein [Saccharothrix obliqua]MBW4719569.1 GPP34 family phosphoprotein [Saccharothrix obliqua]
MLTLADELALLAYDDDGRRALAQPALGHGLAGAVLVELTVAGRIDVVDNRVVAMGTAPLGHRALDAALTAIAADKLRKPADWVERLGRGVTEDVLDGLADQGVLHREQDRVLWVFPRTRFPSPGGVEPPLETEVRRRLTAAVVADGPVDARTAALCAIIEAVRFDGKVFAGLPRDRVRARLAGIAADHRAADATRVAIEQVHAALTAVVVAAVPAATG